MSNLIYKSRSHSKTIQLLNEILNHIDFMQRENNYDEIHISINKSPMLDYHFSYLLELINDKNIVDVTKGKNIYNLFIKPK